MSEFLQAVADHAFLRHALLAGVLAAVAGGVVGAYVVTRRITVIAGSLAHTVLGGMGAAYWLRETRGVDWIEPLHGAVIAALVAAVIITLVRTHWREREDTVISALWAVGMATGVLFLSATPGYKSDLTALPLRQPRPGRRRRAAPAGEPSTRSCCSAWSSGTAPCSRSAGTRSSRGCAA